MKSLLVRLAAVALLGAGAVAVPSAASAHASCESPEDVPVVLEFGTLDGEDRVVCAQHAAGETAVEAVNDAGIETAESSGAMPMVCRIGDCRRRRTRSAATPSTATATGRSWWRRRARTGATPPSACRSTS